MTISLSDIAIPSFLGGLHGLKQYMDKAVADCDSRGLDPQMLLHARLYPNMFSLTQQVQAATDAARRGLDRLVGGELSSVADDESSFGELVARIEATLERVKSADRTVIDTNEDRSFTLELPGVTLPFTSRTYLLSYALPNFYFHLTTTHGILRHNGVDVGKREYLGPIIAAMLR